MDDRGELLQLDAVDHRLGQLAVIAFVVGRAAEGFAETVVVFAELPGDFEGVVDDGLSILRVLDGVGSVVIALVFFVKAGNRAALGERSDAFIRQKSPDRVASRDTNSPAPQNQQTGGTMD